MAYGDGDEIAGLRQENEVLTAEKAKLERKVKRLEGKLKKLTPAK